MDTSEVAAKIGTTPRTLRAFLRSNHSTFVAVGSGARYSFTEKELPTIEKRFSEWQKDGKPKPTAAPEPELNVEAKAEQVKEALDKKAIQDAQDAEVWSEEGPVALEDIRDPRVRARVKADAIAAEDRLMQRLIGVGLHLFQTRSK